MTIDESDAADARRFRWLLSGNGYFMEEQNLCGHEPTNEAERAAARLMIDEQMMPQVGTPNSTPS